jgi:hypothetical protein
MCERVLYTTVNSECTSVADPDPGWVKNPDPESGMNNPDHISESLETTLRENMLKFFDVDPGSAMEKIRIRWKKFGSGMEKIRIRDKHPGSATMECTVRNIKNPPLKIGSTDRRCTQYCTVYSSLILCTCTCQGLATFRSWM